jgi:hypothetical protein
LKRSITFILRPYLDSALKVPENDFNLLLPKVYNCC